MPSSPPRLPQLHLFHPDFRLDGDLNQFTLEWKSDATLLEDLLQQSSYEELKLNNVESSNLTKDDPEILKRGAEGHNEPRDREQHKEEDKTTRSSTHSSRTSRAHRKAPESKEGIVTPLSVRYCENRAYSDVTLPRAPPHNTKFKKSDWKTRFGVSTDLPPDEQAQTVKVIKSKVRVFIWEHFKINLDRSWSAFEVTGRADPIIDGELALPQLHAHSEASNISSSSHTGVWKIQLDSAFDSRSFTEYLSADNPEFEPHKEQTGQACAG